MIIIFLPLGRCLLHAVYVFSSYLYILSALPLQHQLKHFVSYLTTHTLHHPHLLLLFISFSYFSHNPSLISVPPFNLIFAPSLFFLFYLSSFTCHLFTTLSLLPFLLPSLPHSLPSTGSTTPSTTFLHHFSLLVMIGRGVL